MIDVAEYLIKKFDIKVNPDGPTEIKIGRFKDMPRLLAECGLNKGYEVGVYRGRYSKSMLDYHPNLHLTGVDAWEIYGGYKDYEKTDIIDAHREAEETYDKYGDRAILIQGWSTEVAEAVEDESLDFVFIDANHAYEFVVEDIATWSKKVRKGGIVWGHDYDDYSNHKKRWNQMHVQDAVNGWCRSYKISPLFVITNNSNNCWFYIK